MASTRNTRRLTARSAVASTLLGVRPPELPTRSIVATVELLGIAPGTARVAMSRMVAAGELEATSAGYRLVGRSLLARGSRQDLSRAGAPEPWSGRWRLAVAPGEARPAAERSELRAALVALRHGELREGVWLRPDNLPAEVLPDAEASVAARCTTFLTEPDHPGALLLSIVGALTAVVVPSMLYALEIFVGIIQAYVFAMLALVFMSQATVSHSGEH